MRAKEHWDALYAAKAVTEVSWFQRRATVSLDFIMKFSPNRDSVILDAGGGASTLVDGLLLRGYRRVFVLDLARAALDAARHRLGVKAWNVPWVVADVRSVLSRDRAWTCGTIAPPFISSSHARNDRGTSRKWRMPYARTAG